MSIKETIRDIKNRCIVSKSKVADTNVDQLEVPGSWMFYDDDFHKVQIPNTEGENVFEVESAQTRKISNGSDEYVVNDAICSFDGLRYSEVSYLPNDHLPWRMDAYDDWRKCKGKIRSINVSTPKYRALMVLVEKGKDSWEEHYSLPRANCYERYLRFGENKYELPTDINFDDINALRYAFRDKKEIAYFLDKFVIVSPEERESYQKYEKEKALQETKRKYVERKTRETKPEKKQKRTKSTEERKVNRMFFGGHMR